MLLLRLDRGQGYHAPSQCVGKDFGEDSGILYHMGIYVSVVC